MNNIVDRSDAGETGTVVTEQKTILEHGANAENNHGIVTYHTEQRANVRSGEDVGGAHSDSTELKRYSRASTGLLLCIIALSAVGGFLLGQGSRPALTVPVAESGVSGKADADAVAPAPVSVADAQAQAVLVQTEVTEQLGAMRAELLRLHTVFVQLAELAQLDDGEFDLESPLLDWKDQSSWQKMGLLNRRIAHMTDNSSTLTSIFNLRRIAFDQKISGRPLVEGHRTSGFGYRTDPITGERLEHLGLDYSGPVGEPILALADGIVTFSGKNSGYGNLVELEHVGGLRTRYAHNQALLVKSGARVKKGEAIATLGSTGRSTGPHVHIEVRLDGTPIDPGFFVR